MKFIITDCQDTKEETVSKLKYYKTALWMGDYVSILHHYTYQGMTRVKIDHKNFLGYVPLEELSEFCL